VAHSANESFRDSLSSRQHIGTQIENGDPPSLYRPAPSTSLRTEAGGLLAERVEESLWTEEVGQVDGLRKEALVAACRLSRRLGRQRSGELVG